jgi:hypothetical protein
MPATAAPTTRRTRIKSPRNSAPESWRRPPSAILRRTSITTRTQDQHDGNMCQ